MQDPKPKCCQEFPNALPQWQDLIQYGTIRTSHSDPKSLIISILLYNCETRTLTIELQRRIKTVEMRCYHRLLHMDHITNEIVCKKIQVLSHRSLRRYINKCGKLDFNSSQRAAEDLQRWQKISLVTCRLQAWTKDRTSGRQSHLAKET